MAETELHWQVMVDAVETMRDYFAADPMVHVGGNLLLFYEEGNRRRHVAPDAFMVRGSPSSHSAITTSLGGRKAPDVVIEITSKTTKREDQTKKRVLYRDVLKIPEYFQFDPTEDYLKPSLQGVRRIGDDYVPIVTVNGRLPSIILGLHLERSGQELRLWDPAQGSWLLTRQEQRDQDGSAPTGAAARRRAAEQREAIEHQTAEAAQRQLEAGNPASSQENRGDPARLRGAEERRTIEMVRQFVPALVFITARARPRSR